MERRERGERERLLAFTHAKTSSKVCSDFTCSAEELWWRDCWYSHVTEVLFCEPVCTFSSRSFQKGAAPLLWVSVLWDGFYQEPTQENLALCRRPLDWVTALHVLSRAQPWTASQENPWELRNTHAERSRRLRWERADREGTWDTKGQSNLGSAYGLRTWRVF